MAPVVASVVLLLALLGAVVYLAFILYRQDKKAPEKAIASQIRMEAALTVIVRQIGWWPKLMDRASVEDIALNRASLENFSAWARTIVDAEARKAYLYWVSYYTQQITLCETAIRLAVVMPEPISEKEQALREVAAARGNQS